MNLEHARFNMIAQQIRPWYVLNDSVLEAIGSIPREDFVPAEFKELAFADVEIPLEFGENMMFPRVEGRLLQSLTITADDNCLEIGTGSGFLTACLSRMGKHVDSVDIHEAFTRQAEERLQAGGLKNYTLHTGDVLRDWNPNQTYDVIAVTGSVPVYDSRFEELLTPGGRLFMVVGKGSAMHAMLVTRQPDGEFVRTSMFETCLKPLVGAEDRSDSTFVF